MNLKKSFYPDTKKELLEYVVAYNNQIHSSLKGISPITRFFDSGDEIIRIDKRKLNEAFLLEIERKTSPDCVIQIDNIEFEVPQIYSNKRIKLRYSSDYTKCYVVEAYGELTEIKLLDKVANGKIKRKQPIFNLEENKYVNTIVCTNV